TQSWCEAIAPAQAADGRVAVLKVGFATDRAVNKGRQTESLGRFATGRGLHQRSIGVDEEFGRAIRWHSDCRSLRLGCCAWATSSTFPDYVIESPNRPSRYLSGALHDVQRLNVSDCMSNRSRDVSDDVYVGLHSVSSEEHAQILKAGQAESMNVESEVVAGPR